MFSLVTRPLISRHMSSSTASCNFHILRGSSNQTGICIFASSHWPSPACRQAEGYSRLRVRLSILCLSGGVPRIACLDSCRLYEADHNSMFLPVNVITLRGETRGETNS